MVVNFSINGIAYSANFPPKTHNDWNSAIYQNYIYSLDGTTSSAFTMSDSDSNVYYNGQAIQYNGVDVQTSEDIIEGVNYTTIDNGGGLI